MVLRIVCEKKQPTSQRETHLVVSADRTTIFNFEMILSQNLINQRPMGHIVYYTYVQALS
jgi:hypothetical protein